MSKSNATSRRSRGSGTVILDRANRRFVSRYTYADPETGEKRRKSVVTKIDGSGKTAESKARRAAERKLRDLYRLADGQHPEQIAERLARQRGNVPTVATAIDRWVERGCPSRKGRTPSLAAQDQYAKFLARRVVPVLGKRPLDEVSPLDVQAILDSLNDQHLSGATISKTYRGLRAAIDLAIREGTLNLRNPADLVTLPHADPNGTSAGPHVLQRPVAHRDAWTADEVAALRAEFAGHRTVEPWLTIALATGARPGEIAVLRWAPEVGQDPDRSYLDVDTNTVYIRSALKRGGRVPTEGSTKTGQSGRRVLRGVFTADEIEMLRAHRERQAEEARLRGWASPVVCPTSPFDPTDLVVRTTNGDPVEATLVTGMLKRAAVKIGLDPDRCSAYSARHTAATRIASTLRIERAAEVLGHASISTTRGYRHADPEVDLTGSTPAEDTVVDLSREVGS